MATKTLQSKGSRAKASPTTSRSQQTKLSFQNAARNPSASGANNALSGNKAKQKPNGKIMDFFKKMEEKEVNALFVEERKRYLGNELPQPNEDQHFGDSEDDIPSVEGVGLEERFNELEGSVKRRRISLDAPAAACSPPLPDAEALPTNGDLSERKLSVDKHLKHGPFLEDSDSEDEAKSVKTKIRPRRGWGNTSLAKDDTAMVSDICEGVQAVDDPDIAMINEPLVLKRELTGDMNDSGFEAFENIEDYEEEEYDEGEEYLERRYMQEQRRLEIAEGVFEGGENDFELGQDESPWIEDIPDAHGAADEPTCPICNVNLVGISDQDASRHVNNCLDGNPTPLPEKKNITEETPSKKIERRRQFQPLSRPAKPGQVNPFSLGKSTEAPTSAFSRLMSGHAEDIAWATAAKAESAARGKPSFQRTCPFYKILPGLFICVDAFRYGAVKDCHAYFLSHFHSDHYVGLTSSWCHGPIYCSRVTANLVRQQLRVDPKWVVDLEFEQKVEVPNTQGVFVTMIPANHCPGSSLFLFEKNVGSGKAPRTQRVLHCGDFRACRAHIEHPLLRPDLLNSVGQKIGQQRIDVCYLDTTYLNPKYAFPSQEDVITACAEMCVSLNKVKVDTSDGWEKMKKDRAGDGMVKFVQKAQEAPKQDDPARCADAMSVHSTTNQRGRLLVVVGTYSIGKERICMGIARALDCKIYAPPGKQRICACLEDPELNARLTTDPSAAQVHMTPLFEIRAETLDDYLKDYSAYFSRAVGFRPSGWNYRPPNSRFVESPSVQTVLHSANWKTGYSMKDLIPQRGSTSRASCFEFLTASIAASEN